MNANTNSESHLAPAGSGIEPAVVERIADPVNWEVRYRSGDTPWDKGCAAPALEDFLSSHPIRGEVLVPGSGLGYDVRAVSAQGGSVVGLDLSETAVEQARLIPPTGSETYAQGDLFRPPESWKGHFDWVVEHTCFCAIPPASRDHYVRSIAGMLKPGGFYFAIFYMNPDAPQGPPHGVTREEIAILFDPCLELLREWTPIRAFEGREGKELCQLRRLKS